MHPAQPEDDSLHDTGEFPALANVADEQRPSSVRVEFAARTHPGQVRSNNEDQFLVARLAKSMFICASSLIVEEEIRFSDEQGYLMVVADGMGGAAAGEHASSLAITTVESFVLNTVKWFLHLGQPEESELLSELRQSLERADRDVIERAWADSELSGMGTTLTMGYSVGTDLFVVHAGDSRAYLFRDGELTQMTADHTLVQLLIDGGALTPEDAKHHRRRNVVTNVIGGPEVGVQAEIHKVPLADGDVILLCTDGLTETVEEPRIAEVLGRNGDPAPSQRCPREFGPGRRRAGQRHRHRRPLSHRAPARSSGIVAGRDRTRLAPAAPSTCRAPPLDAKQRSFPMRIPSKLWRWIAPRA